MDTRTELNTQRDEALAKAQVLGNSDQELTDEEDVKFNELMQEADSLQARIDRQARLAEANKIENKLPAQLPGTANTVLTDTPVVPAPAANTVPASANRYGSNLNAWKGPDAGLKAYRAGKFLQATIFGNEGARQYCHANGIKIEAAMSSTDNAAGGFSIFEEYSTSIIDLAEQYGVFRKFAGREAMSSDTKIIPRITGGITGSWVGENTAPSESNITGDNIRLVAKTRAAMTVVPNELNDDSVINLADKIATKMALSFATIEDQCGFIGDGSDTYAGMYGAAVKINDDTGTTYAGSIYIALQGNTAFSSLDDVDFLGLIGLLPEYARLNAKFYISRQGFYASLARLARAAGGNTKDDIAGGTGLMYEGFPVVISQVLNTTLTAQTDTILCLFGDLAMAAAFGDRATLTIGSDAGGKFFEQGSIAIRSTERFDINIHELGDTTNAGALVALKTYGS